MKTRKNEEAEVKTTSAGATELDDNAAESVSGGAVRPHKRFLRRDDYEVIDDTTGKRVGKRYDTYEEAANAAVDLGFLPHYVPD